MSFLSVKEATTAVDLDFDFDINKLLDESIIKHNNNHHICKIDMKEFLKINIRKWKYNRPPDMLRVEQIAKSLIDKKYPLSFMFQCIYNRDKNCLELIDGQHRYCVIQAIQEQTKKDFMEKHEINEWFYKSTLLIELKLNHTEKEIKEWFCVLNRTIPVPHLYIDPEDQKIEIVEEVVNKYYAQYILHFRSSDRPNIANTSKTRFTELICFIYEEFDISLEKKQLIYKILEDINKLIKNKVINDAKKFNKKITPKSIEKCSKTDLFLFLADEDILKNLIRKYEIL